MKGLTKEVAVPADPLMLAAGSLRYLTFTGLLFTLPFVLAVLPLVREWRLAGWRERRIEWLFVGGLLLFAGPAVLLFLINAYRPADPVSLVAGPGDLGNLRTFFYFQLAILLGVLLLAVRAIVRRARAGKAAASGRKMPGKAHHQGGRKQRGH